MASTQQLLLGEGAGGAEKNYIEDVFSTYLVTGAGTSYTVNNGIDLSTKGGMAWMKRRSGAQDNYVFDTVRGAGKALVTNDTIAQYNNSQIDSFTTTGFTGSFLANASTNVFWTFRKQPKFFDIAIWTGDGSGTGRQISHSLGSTPGCIILKSTSTAGTNWIVYHRSLATNFTLKLQTTDAAVSNAWISTVTDTYFTGSGSAMNVSGQTYVAYIFAHDAGGFGLTGTDNVISCGSFTASANSATVNLGYEPQWLLCKNANSAEDWFIYDTMRGWSFSAENRLVPNTSAAEVNDGTSSTVYFVPTATGFEIKNYVNNNTYIYIAIRRGPMKVPTDATKVFAVDKSDGTSVPSFNAGFSIDAALLKATTVSNGSLRSRLTGTGFLETNSTAAEGTNSFTQWDYQDSWYEDNISSSYYSWMFQRAPSFFDEVCYTGTGSYPFTINHNLGVVPELIIFKKRSATDDWWTYAKPITSPNANWYQNFLRLNGTAASASDTTSLTTTPTSTTIPVADYYAASGATYVAYLFATCAGVSKVGSYTGTGTTKQVDCGFAAGARFVLIKRTDSTGDWYVWDTARGIVSGNDPYLLLNSTAAEVTSTDYIDTYSAGFEISSTAPAAINASGGTFIFLAIA